MRKSRKRVTTLFASSLKQHKAKGLGDHFALRFLFFHDAALEAQLINASCDSFFSAQLHQIFAAKPSSKLCFSQNLALGAHSAQPGLIT